MKWFRNHKQISIIVTVMIVLMFIIVSSYSNAGSSFFGGHVIHNIITFIQKPISGSANGVESGLKGIFKFRTIIKENEALKDENSALKLENIKLKLNKKELKDLKDLSNILNYNSVNDNYNYVTADVTSMDGSNWFNIFTINAGSKDGLYKDAVVMDGYGLIGRVLDLGSNWSKVISIIDESNSVSFKVQREKDKDLLGILSGDGKGGLTGFMLDPEAAVVEGDLLITTGMGMYPEGIAIGKVDKIELNPDTLLKTLKIESTVDFKSIEKVTVIISKS
ncbi:rod shape-determining protein MreC [Anaerovorax odorimutans]|uniref:rod shape-determining protein MreC n=1 Tax=Anaerovorax odorimutans TaxID=109327 RepID=UPI0004260BB3|nr:rod shape-determining protein MreC [Anaerovorax odorimutans]